MKRLFILVLLVNNFVAANNLANISNILKHVETNYRLHMIGDGGDSWGVLQIQEAVIKDINRKYGTTYTHQDAFDENCAEEIFELYIQMWTENLEKKENREATEYDIVRIWNGGPRGYKRNGTLDYLEKYKEYKDKLVMSKQQCYVKGKLGVIMETYDHTYDIWMCKDKKMMYGVSKKVVFKKKRTQTQKEIRAKTQTKLEL